MSVRILVINPGSTSTKIAVWQEEKGLTLEDNIQHPPQEMEKFEDIPDQLEYRVNVVRDSLQGKGYEAEDFSAIAARGGLLKPLAGGTYQVNSIMRRDLKTGVQGQHPSNLAGLIGHELGREQDLPVYITDPVSVDEFNPLARYSGIPEIERRSLGHALNIKAVARLVASEMGKNLETFNGIVAHLGGGISIAPLEKGKIVDVNNANEMGPYSPERTGGLPVTDLVKMAFSGNYTARELRNKITRRGGLLAYLGTNDCREIEERIAGGDQEARQVYEGMIYQISKEIGMAATVLRGDVEKIIITGGIAHSEYLISGIKKRVQFIAPLRVVPGSMEMEALALGAYRVVTGREMPGEYGEEVD